jgi:NDP-sugar pyrophosphorylase family protein
MSGMRASEAVILAGGKGTRLRPYTVSIPKPLVPLGDDPIIEILVRQLELSGIRRIHIALGHLANLVKAYFEQTNSRRDVELIYWEEPTALGTIGPIKQMQGLGDTFLVINGDVLTTLSYENLIEDHHRQGCIATLAVHRREVPMDYGVVEVTGGRIVGHREKPSLEVEVGMGICVFDHRVLEYIPANRKFDIPELIHKLLAAGEGIAAHESTDYWMDIGRADDYEIAHRDYTAAPERFVPRIQR